MHIQVHRSAAHWARRYDLDYDELATRITDQVAQQRYGHFVDEAYTHHVARRTAIHSLVGSSSGEDIAAWREYNRQVSDWENAHGEQVSGAQAQRIADRVRMDQPPSRRAARGFHLRAASHRTTSLESHPEKDRRRLDDLLPHAPAADGFIDSAPSSPVAVDRAVARIGELAQEQGAYAALAATYRLPAVKVASIGEEAAARIRRQVRSLDGPRRAASRWLAGEIDDATAEPLFVPFGGSDGMSIEDMSALAERFSTLPTSAGKDPAGIAYASALRSATNVRPRAPRQWSGAARGRALKTS